MRGGLKMKLLPAVLIALCSLSLAVAAGDSGGAPEVGDAAPPFSLQGSDGKTYALADFAGKKAVVIAWFPKAFTGG
jgi:peroxiredoxin Q/BCP